MPLTTLRTSLGNEYRDWVEPMPGIPPEIINSVIYLYQDKSDSETGNSTGGSGFLLRMDSEVPRFNHIYAVTNAHVIEMGFPVIRVNLEFPASGNVKTETRSFPEASWVIHERHDLAVRPLPADVDFKNLRVDFLTPGHFVTKQQYDEGYLNLGDELAYVGRFTRHGGVFTNVPSVRFGNISMFPNDNEPIQYDVDEECRERHYTRRFNQVSFLVEARSRSGYSGSPVFLLDEKHIKSPKGKRRPLWPAFGEIRLLGIDWGHILEDVTIKPENRVIQINSGMMGVVPVWYLDEFLRSSPRLIEQRRRDDEYYASIKSSGERD